VQLEELDKSELTNISGCDEKDEVVPEEVMLAQKSFTLKER
jgi:hypothetical protein